MITSDILLSLIVIKILVIFSTKLELLITSIYYSLDWKVDLKFAHYEQFIIYISYIGNTYSTGI